MLMTDLTSRLVASVNSKGNIQVKESAKKYTRQKLDSEFGGVLHIFPDDNGKLLLYPDNLSMSNQTTVTNIGKVLEKMRQPQWPLN